MQFTFNKRAFSLALLNKGYTITELANISKVSKNNISKCLHTGIKPSAKTIKKIADALEVDAKELVILND